ncbi:CD209 antigen-like protein A [Fukomys damarensis]|uniref:CD209 antigen-like protein A n=1 Tax=Fukomys damarensis TaxID=885580 RepID=UPI0014552AE5|nr:CD209 antigen-like protein A [Fukomys damarensis]
MIYQELTRLSVRTGALGHFQVAVVLQLLFLLLFIVTLLTVLVQGPKVLSSQEQEVIYQELTRLSARVDLLCRPCPWDWTHSQGNCYFFSKSKQNWSDSVPSCQETGAQLVIIQSEEASSTGTQISPATITIMTA